MTGKIRTVAIILALVLTWSATAHAQPPKPGVQGYEVEWVYRVRYGYIDEWWDLPIFQVDPARTR